MFRVHFRFTPLQDLPAMIGAGMLMIWISEAAGLSPVSQLLLGYFGVVLGMALSTIKRIERV